MKILKIILLILLIVFVGIQFIPTKRNQNDVVPNTDFMLVNKVPKDIKNNLQVSCYDCHSNNTQYPWYSKIQPGAWFMENHIKDGKTELNFSEWDSLSNRRKKSKLKSIISQIEDNKMPLSSYTLIHRNAIFSEAEKQRITTYLTELKSNL
ncbi:heme-binding domain-containing protein [Flavobacterium sp.]|uniref:heme-binding domain-containing protein n=1 Tax=Flavobacterium sp. TaxID=239 RepID=UPI002605BD2D|nr:heme-binding domain-containing protein [Flavobacterium sp.]MDG2432001.1 heme-binding domain-containing protein [Flavobacterium sp.]